MPKYTVCGQEFECFNDVCQWAWNTYKLSFEGEDEMLEAEQLEACSELEECVKLIKQVENKEPLT